MDKQKDNAGERMEKWGCAKRPGELRGENRRGVWEASAASLSCTSLAQGELYHIARKHQPLSLFFIKKN
jgi:hypothetical protein